MVKKGHSVNRTEQWWQRILRAMEAKGWNVRELSRRSTVDHDTVYKYVAGKVKNPRSERVQLIATALDVSPDWVMFGIAGSLPDNYHTPVRYIPLIFASELSSMEDAVDTATKKILAPADVGLRSIGITIEDDSLAGDNIRRGDVVIVDIDAPPIPGKPVAAVLTNPDRGIVRRYRPLDTAGKKPVQLIASHSDYPEEQIKPGSKDHIVGPVVYHIRKI